MNCPSRNDEPLEHEGWNQNPSALAADLTTREDLNGKVNRRTNQDSSKEAEDARTEPRTHGSTNSRPLPDEVPGLSPGDPNGNGSIGQPGVSHANVQSWFKHRSLRSKSNHSYVTFPALEPPITLDSQNPNGESPSRRTVAPSNRVPKYFRAVGQVLRKFLGFVGPGFIVAVAYIDPGNYSTDVAAGVATEFKLLFIVFLSNIFAIVLQSLAIRLGTVTGLNLAEHCRAQLPRWLNIFLYILAEAAIIATDIAEVSCSKILKVQPERFLGHRLGHCTQFATETSSGMGLYHHSSRRPHHPHILQSKSIHEAFALL